MKRALLGVIGLAACACAHTRRDASVPAGAGPLVAVYKTVINDGQGPARGAKLSVWAERPDRIHAELIAPVGGVRFILDAGGGNSCIVDVAAATAYVGEDGPEALGALVGVRVSAAEAVAALLDGASPTGFAVTRTGGAGGELPQKLLLTDGTRSLGLDRVRWQRGGFDPRTLGTGAPPEKLQVRPFEDLAADDR